MSAPSGKSAKNAPSRAFDIIVWGVGFTGVLVAKYLARHYKPDTLRFALAGRSRVKLEAARAELVAIDPRFATLELLIGDATAAPTELDALVSKVRGLDIPSDN